MKRLFFIIILALSLLEFQVIFANNLLDEKTLNMQKENEIIVSYKSDKKDIQALSSKVSGVKKINSKTEIISVKNKEDIENVISTYKNNKGVKKVTKNSKRVINSLPNDQYYNYQWGHSAILANKIWNINQYAKKSIVVAVIDSGIDTDHPDLTGRIASGGYNFYAESLNYEDDEGHGTAVSGVICAKTNNNIGIAGVAGAFDIKILPIKTINSSGEGYVFDEILAIDYAISKKVDVINISLGGDTFIDEENDAVQRAINAGIVVVASAGNDGDLIYSYPASYDNVISVGATQSSGTIADYSNYNDRLDIAAPGSSILTTMIGGGYAYYFGTSFSAPMVSGVVAVLKATKPNLLPSEIENIIKSTATDKGEIGRDNKYGFGLINASAALSLALNLSLKSISLDKNSFYMLNGETLALNVLFSPTDAINKDVFWSSSNEIVAKVDANGNVLAKSVGKATITAMSNDGGFLATCNILISDNYSLNSFYRVLHPVLIDENGLYKQSIKEFGEKFVYFKIKNTDTKDKTATLIFASYDEKGKLILMQNENLTLISNTWSEIKKQILDNQNTLCFKVFIMDNTINIMPVANYAKFY